jgi:hypothetical protein
LIQKAQTFVPKNNEKKKKNRKEAGIMVIIME